MMQNELNPLQLPCVQVVTTLPRPGRMQTGYHQVTTNNKIAGMLKLEALWGYTSLEGLTRQ